VLLSEFECDIVQRPGKIKVASDALSRVYCVGFHKHVAWSARCSVPSLCVVLVSLSSSKHLPYSTNGVKKIVGSLVCV